VSEYAICHKHCCLSFSCPTKCSDKNLRSFTDDQSKKGTGNQVFDTGRFESQQPESFSFTLPFEGFLLDREIEFRFLGFEGQYFQHTAALAGFGLNGAFQVVEPAGLSVTSVAPTNNGFVAQFNRPIDATALNLYDAQAVGLAQFASLIVVPEIPPIPVGIASILAESVSKPSERAPVQDAGDKHDSADLLGFRPEMDLPWVTKAVPRIPVDQDRTVLDEPTHSELIDEIMRAFASSF
jgi:hypothetical protein